MQTTPNTLIDAHGRQVDYIRLSITDRCDFRCTYCMGEDVSFLSREEVLSLEECARVVKAFVSLGVSKVRITGGEPLLGWQKVFPEITFLWIIAITKHHFILEMFFIVF